MKPPPLFIINLPQAAKRRGFMREQLERYGLTGEFFPAVDGPQLSPDYLAKFDLAGGAALIQRQMTPGEYGCLFSHYEVCRALLATGEQLALILEDDAVLSPQLAQLLQQLSSLPSGWDLLHLGYWPRWNQPGALGARGYPLSFWQRQTLMFGGHKHYLGPFIDVTEGTHAYLLRAAGAAKIVRLVEEGEILPYDIFLNWHATKFSYYGIAPALSNQREMQLLEQHLEAERNEVFAALAVETAPSSRQRLDHKITQMLSWPPLRLLWRLSKEVRRDILRNWRTLVNRPHRRRL